MRIGEMSETHDFGSREYFLSVYNELRDLVCDTIVPSYGLPAEAAAWNRDMLEYNVPGALT